MLGPQGRECILGMPGSTASKDVLDGIGDAADGGAHDDGALARVHPGSGLCRDRRPAIPRGDRRAAELHHHPSCLIHVCSIQRRAESRAIIQREVDVVDALLVVGVADSGCAYISDKHEDWRLDPDDDGVGIVADCDSSDASVGAERAWYRDVDEDGFGDEADVTYGCERPAG